MKEICLDWNLIPCCIFEHLDRFKGKDSFYNPFFGPGVYLYIYPSKKGYQIYYIGESNEIGNRLVDHYQEYIKPNPKFYLPVSSEYFDEDVYKYYSSSVENSSEFITREGGNISFDMRKDIGRKIMQNSYIAIGELEDADKGLLKDVESILHFAVLKYNNLTKNGWFGETHSQLPSKEYVIKSIYRNDVIKNMITNTLPNEIILKDSEIQSI